MNKTERTQIAQALRAAAQSLSAAKKAKPRTTIEDDTPIMPWIVADTVIEEVCNALSDLKLEAEAEDLYGKKRDWADALSEDANRVYKANDKFAKDMNAPGNKGRDTLYMFMRHWLAAKIKKELPKIDQLLKTGARTRWTHDFALGKPLGKMASAKSLPGDKWDEDGVNDAIKEITTGAMQNDETPSSFRMSTSYLGWLDDAVLGASNVRKHQGEFPSDDKALLKRIETEVKKNLAAAPVAASTKVKAAGSAKAKKVKASTAAKVESKGQLKDGIWEGESISFVVSLSELLDDLGLKYASKWAKDGSYEVSDAPSARELTDYGKETSSEAITCFPDAARHAYMTAMESGIEAYLAKHYSESVIDVLEEISGTADYEGEGEDGEPAIVKQNYSVTAEETGDVDGIYSDPYIKITVDEPLHLNNGPLADARITDVRPVNEPFGAESLSYALGSYLQEEFSREVKNIEDTNTDNADMDKDIFDEFFANNVLEMDPGEIAEAIQTYANDSDESVEDVVDTMMKDVPGLDKMSGAIASALEGGYDARQQKLPLSSASASLKALATAEKAIKAAARKPTPKQQKKLDDKRIEQAYYKVADGVQIDMMAIPKVFKVGEAAIAQGADDAALEKAIADFVETIREN